MNTKLAPIVLFVYNRPDHTKKTIESLQMNTLCKDSELFIYSDAPKNETSEAKVNTVRHYIKTIKGFKKIKIIERENNWGLANSVISGVSEIVDRYGKVIVLEDDLETTPYFLQFMNEALNYYEKDDRVMSISGYSYPFKFPDSYMDDTFLFYRSSSWGWAIWKNEWNSIDFDITKEHKIFKDKTLQSRFNLGGEDLYDMLISQMEGRINSWAIRFALSHALNNKYGLLPSKSLVQNIGFDLSGTHCEASDNFKVLLEPNFLPRITNIHLNKEIVKNLQKTFSKSLFQKIKYNIKKIVK